MNELLKPLENEHQQLVAELPVIEALSDDLQTQADKIDALEKALEEILCDLKTLSQ